MRVVVTGASGFIGSEIVRHLLKRTDVHSIYAIIRSTANQSGQVRFANVVEHWRRYFVIPADDLAKVTVVEADLTASHRQLLESIPDAEFVFHCAASTDLGLPLQPARAINVTSTQKVVLWAQTLPSLRRVVHFSTAYVLGRMKGCLDEATAPTQFNNGYEQSKYEAEQIFRIASVPYTIVRPSLVVGDSQSGYVRGQKIIYAALRAWLTNAMPRAPIDPKGRIDLIPVDYVIKVALLLAYLPEANGQIYHLTSGERAPTAREVFSCAIDVFELGEPRLCPPQIARLLAHRLIRPFLSHRLQQIVELMQTHFPYLGHRSQVFLTEKVDALVASSGVVPPTFDRYGETIFRFCRDTRWGKLPLIEAPNHV